MESGSKTLSKKDLSFEPLWPPLNGKNCDPVVTPDAISWKRGYIINLGVAFLSESWTVMY